MEVPQGNGGNDPSAGLFDLTGLPANEAWTLRLLLRAKGFAPGFSELPCSARPAFEYRQRQIEGFWPIVEFLMELKPWPVLLPEQPLERALFRSIAEQALGDAGQLTELLDLYADDPRPFGALRLPDFVVAGYAWRPDFSHHLSTTKRVACGIVQFCQTIEEEQQCG